MKHVISFVAFTIGAATGSVVTWRFVKKKYEQIAQEEIDSVKAVFCKKTHDDSEEPESVEEETVSVADYAKKLQETGYTSYSNSEKRREANAVKEEERSQAKAPYVIPPDNFGEFEDYDQISLTYYADHVLAEDDDLIEDVEGSVGFDSLNHFGEYEEDSVHVRNDRLKVDYEILKDVRTWSEVLKSKPYLKED